MNAYVPRTIEDEIRHLLKSFTVVLVTGPRQVGKTSLVLHLRPDLVKNAIYLDLEYPVDLNKLSNPVFFLEANSDKLVIIDEVQRMPGLFPILRSLVDRGRTPGRFILLGSASPDLLRQSSESLAGRVAYLELQPFSFSEIVAVSDMERHWLRGGFPESLLAKDDRQSMDWRIHFIQTYLERDLPNLGLSADPVLIRRLWTMIAHVHGQVLNMQMFARSLGISGQTVRRYLDFMESAFLIRRLPPWFQNTKKRLVRSPKIYVRDSGILHALLNISDATALLGHPVAGNSWEGYVVQEILAHLPHLSELYFYRTQDGSEADVVILKSGKPTTLAEIKLSQTPSVRKGFRIAAADLGTRRNFIITPLASGYPLGEDVDVLGYTELDKLFS